MQDFDSVENSIAKFEECSLNYCESKSIQGTLYFTPYQLIFKASKPEEINYLPYRFRCIPYLSISKIEQSKFKKSGTMVTIFWRPFRRTVFDLKETVEFTKLLDKKIYPKVKFENTYCFQCQGTTDCYSDPLKNEFARTGISKKNYVIYLNEEATKSKAGSFSFYPFEFYVPNTVGVLQIKDMASYRDDRKFLLPIYAIGDAVLLIGNRPLYTSAPNEPMDIFSYRAKNPKIKDNKLHIFDVGSKKQFYLETYCKFEFLQLPNTKTLARYYTEIDELLTNSSLNSAELGWSKTISIILQQAHKIAILFKKGLSLGIQGHSKNSSHMVLASVVQIFLEPYYRTIKGLCVLIEKDWILGYDFYEIHKPEVGPYFELFLNCIYELIKRNYYFFEYDFSILAHILECTYSGKYGSFLFYHSKYREKLWKSPSFWDHIMQEKIKWTNPLWESTHTELFPPVACTSVWDYLQENQWHKEQHWSKSLLENGKKMEETGKLELRSCNLSHFPGYLLLVNNLKVLNLSDNLLVSLPENFWQCKELEELDLSGNPIHVPDHLPSCIKHMPAFKTLKMSRLEKFTISTSFPNVPEIVMNQIKSFEIPDTFEQALTIRSLEMRSNAFEAPLKKWFRKLESLQKLDLGSNQLDKINELYFYLKLQQLNLSNNRLEQFPIALPKLTLLQSLDLSSNILSSITPDLVKLTSLLHLNLSSNKNLSTILNTEAWNTLFPTSLVSLTLNYTDLKSNKMVLKYFENLEYLDLSHNQISTISLDILALTRLATLNLSDNELLTLPLAIGEVMTSLTHLDISSNSLSVLPPSLGLLKLEKFYWSGNVKLEETLPPEILQTANTNGLLGYLKDLTSGIKKLFRIKVMLVGQENVGKTSVVRALAKGWSNTEHGFSQITGDTVSTDGIDITSCTFIWDNAKHKINNLPLEKIPVEVSFWDFAGQEVYYTTHQFFLSERSIYVIVWSMTIPLKSSQVGYWLNSICSKVKKPNVLILGTHYDAIPEREKENLSNTLENDFQEIVAEFPNIKLAIIPVSLKNDMYGFQDFRSRLEKVIVSQNHMGESLPRSYMLLEQLVIEERMKYNPPILTRDEWIQIGKICSLNESDELMRATNLLHNFGSLVHFEDDPELRNIVILNPQWLSDVMATLITTKHNFASSGILKHSILPQIWKPPSYPESIYPHLMNLLRKFEIAYELTSDISDGNLASSSNPYLPPVPSSLPPPLSVPPVPSSLPPPLSVPPVPSTLPPPLIVPPVPSTLPPPLIVLPVPEQQETKTEEATGWSKVAEKKMIVPQPRISQSVHRTKTQRKPKEEPEITEPKNGTETSPESAEDELALFKRTEENTQGWNIKGISLIPCLLSQQKPPSIINYWKTFIDPDLQECNRYIQFTRFVPKGFAARLMVRILNQYPPRHFQTTLYWAEGLFLGTRPVSIMVRLFSMKKELSLAVRGKNPSTISNVFCNLMATVNLLTVEWANLETKQSIRCVGCSRESTKASFHHFSEDDLQSSSLKGENSVCCPACKETMKISDLAPDLVMVYFNGPKVKVEDLVFDEIVGQGGFAAVWRGKWENKEVGIKKLDTSRMAEAEDQFLRAFTEFRKEIYALSRIKSVYCLKLHAICLDPLCIVTEFLSCGDLFDFLHKKTTIELTWRMRVKLAHDISSGLTAMHKGTPPLMHLDLKTPNILLVTYEPNAPVVAKLIDFGLSSTADTQYIRHVDNPTWLAPEILQGSPYDNSVDIYSLGVIFYEILSRKQFFGEESFSTVISENVLEGKRPEIPQHCFPEWKEWIETCWAQQPSKRPKIDVVNQQIKEFMKTLETYHEIAKVSYCLSVLLNAQNEALEKSPQFFKIHKSVDDALIAQRKFLSTVNVPEKHFFTIGEQRRMLRSLEELGGRKKEELTLGQSEQILNLLGIGKISNYADMIPGMIHCLGVVKEFEGYKSLKILEDAPTSDTEKPAVPRGLTHKNPTSLNLQRIRSTQMEIGNNKSVKQDEPTSKSRESKDLGPLVETPKESWFSSRNSVSYRSLGKPPAAAAAAATAPQSPSSLMSPISRSKSQYFMGAQREEKKKQTEKVINESIDEILNEVQAQLPVSQKLRSTKGKSTEHKSKSSLLKSSTLTVKSEKPKLSTSATLTQQAKANSQRNQRSKPSPPPIEDVPEEKPPPPPKVEVKKSPPPPKTQTSEAEVAELLGSLQSNFFSSNTKKDISIRPGPTKPPPSAPETTSLPPEVSAVIDDVESLLDDIPFQYGHKTPVTTASTIPTVSIQTDYPENEFSVVDDTGFFVETPVPQSVLNSRTPTKPTPSPVLTPTPTPTKYITPATAPSKMISSTTPTKLTTPTATPTKLAPGSHSYSTPSLPIPSRSLSSQKLNTSTPPMVQPYNPNPSYYSPAADSYQDHSYQHQSPPPYQQYHDPYAPVPHLTHSYSNPAMYPPSISPYPPQQQSPPFLMSNPPNSTYFTPRDLLAMNAELINSLNAVIQSLKVILNNLVTYKVNGVSAIHRTKAAENIINIITKIQTSNGVHISSLSGIQMEYPILSKNLALFLGVSKKVAEGLQMDDGSILKYYNEVFKSIDTMLDNIGRLSWDTGENFFFFRS